MFYLPDLLSVELLDSEIINIALVPDSSPVIFTNICAAHLLMATQESCTKITSCINISGSFNRSSRPSVVAVTPVYILNESVEVFVK